MFTNIVPFLALVTLTFHIQTLNPKSHSIGIDGCTAVYVSPNEALTAAHCVEGTTGKMWVRDSDNRAFTVQIIKQDKKLDLCLLQINNGRHPHKYVTLGSPVSINQHIHTMGNDDNMPFTYGEGIVKNIVIDSDSHVLMIIHSATILPGASGGGLFDRWGRLVGINTLCYKGIAYAVDVTVIEGFLGKRRG